MESGVIEEIVWFSLQGTRLEGVMAYPADTAPIHAVLCVGPHPHLGGSMDNNVIRHIAQQAASDGAVTVRFNYRGIGQSGIELPAQTSVFDYYEDIESHKRYAAVLPDAIAAMDFLTHTAPSGLGCTVVGYSLGAVIAYMLAHRRPVAAVVAISPPVRKVDLTAHVTRCARGIVVGGDPDFAFDPDLCRAQMAQLGRDVSVVQIPGCDHFFRKREHRLYETIKPWLNLHRL